MLRECIWHYIDGFGCRAIEHNPESHTNPSRCLLHRASSFWSYRSLRAPISPTDSSDITPFLYYASFITPIFDEREDRGGEREAEGPPHSTSRRQRTNQKKKEEKKTMKMLHTKRNEMYIKYDSGFIYLSNKYKQNRNKNLHKMTMKRGKAMKLCGVYFIFWFSGAR